MADKTEATDEELELERQRELEEEEKNSDVDTSIPKEEDAEDLNNDDKGEGEDTPPDTDEPEEGSEEEEQPAPDGADEDKQTRQTRKERRAERAKRFSELRNGFSQREQQRQQLMQPQRYNPMDYNQADQFNVDELEQDRRQYGNAMLTQGAQLERFYATQERFNDRLESDNDYILNKPEYAFLDETNEEAFDADLADGVNDLFLSMAGYDDQTKTYANTNLRYKEFVPMIKNMMDKYAATRNQNSERNISKQRSSAGVRPTAGASRGSSRTFTPEQIARMTPAQYARYEKDIDRQINALI